MELNLPDLSHIGNKYRKKTKEIKNEKLRKKFKKPDRYDNYAVELAYRQAFRSVLNKYPYGAPLKDIRKEVHETIWILDYPHSKTAFPKVLQFFSQRRIVGRFRLGKTWYLKNTRLISCIN